MAYIDFTAKTPGAMPSRMDTGQPITRTWNFTAAADPVISNPGQGSRYTIATMLNGPQAGYLTCPVGGRVTTLEATWQHTTSGSGGGSLALVAWKYPMPAGSLAGITVQESPFHGVFTPSGWNVQVMSESTSTLSTVRTYSYPSAYTDATPRPVSVVIDAANSQARVTGWDGNTVTITDARFGTYQSFYACCEIYYNDADSERRVAVLDFTTDSAPVGPPPGPRGVITIPGAFSVYNTNNFGGALFAAPNIRVANPPNNGWRNFLISESAAAADVVDLDALIRSVISQTPGAGGLFPIVVAGHSRGGQLIYKWIRERAATTDINPAHVRFISSGNPERKYHGRSFNRPDAYPPVYPGTGGPGVGYGLPADGNCYGFELLDIARQYDIWADHPDDWTNAAALSVINQVNAHSAYHINPSLGTDGLPVDWDDWGWFTEGDVTYLTSASFPLVPEPDLPPMAKMFGGRIARNHRLQFAFAESVKRAPAEAAYDRLVPVPLPSSHR